MQLAREIRWYARESEIQDTGRGRGERWLNQSPVLAVWEKLDFQPIRNSIMLASYDLRPDLRQTALRPCVPGYLRDATLSPSQAHLFRKLPVEITKTITD